MGSVKSYNNGALMKLTPKPARLGGIVAGVNPDEAVNKAQLDELQQGEIDLARIELSADGTAAAPVITRDGDTDTGIYFIGANNIGVSANGAKVLDIATTGLAVTGAISATTTVTATTGISLGTDLTGLKEVNHTITVATTTTAATAGGNLTLLGATGATSGAGGDIIVTGGTGGATAASVGGAITVTTGVSGAGGGASGVLSVKSGIGTTSTGTATFGSGNASGGTSGNVTVTSGTGTTASGTATYGSGNATTTSGNVTLSSGTGDTAGTVIVSTSNATTTAGALTISTGTASTTGGLIRIDTGNISAGTSAAVAVTTGTGTTGTGAISFTTGNASAGTAGNITLAVGTASSTTVSPTTIIASNTVNKPLNTASVATGVAITGRQLVDGYIAITGGTGNVTLPDTSAITTAVGATPAGTVLNFTVNAVGMTATNTVTFVVGANMSVASAPAITGGGTLTLTQDTQVIGVFKLVFITATTTKLFRIA